jgi:hypothetical protein
VAVRRWDVGPRDGDVCGGVVVDGVFWRGGEENMLAQRVGGQIS